MQPRLYPIVQKDRKLATFSLDVDSSKPTQEGRCQGWLNSATWCFQLYFFQEADLVAEFEGLIRKRDRKVNYTRAMRLFHEAQLRNRMEQIDDDSEGLVNVQEIVDFQLSERNREAQLAS